MIGLQKQKTVHLNVRRIPVILLWTLLIGSIAFGVWNNFTAVDTRTYVVRELVETHLMDTSSIESFAFNFAKIYHAWPSDHAERAVRHERLRAFLTDELHMLNLNMLRSDVAGSAVLQAFQIWNMEQLDEHNFKVRYSVHQLIRAATVAYVEDVIHERVEGYDGAYHYVEVVIQREEERYTEESVRSFFVVTVHMDDAGNMVITRNPTVTQGVGRSDYVPPIRADSGMVDGVVRAEVLQFLQDFFVLYPGASESTLASFVRDGALTPLEVEYEFVDIVSAALVPDGERVIAYITVRFYDPRTFAYTMSQFGLVLERGDSWVIVGSLI